MPSEKQYINKQYFDTPPPPPSWTPCTEIQVLVFQALGQSKSVHSLAFSETLIRSDKGPTHETSALKSLYGGQFTLVINSVDKPNIRFYPPTTQHHSFFRN